MNSLYCSQSKGLLHPQNQKYTKQDLRNARFLLNLDIRTVSNNV